jgi:hypothetical protein
MTSKEILIERERIKKKYDELLKAVMKRRQFMAKSKSRRVVPFCELYRMEENFFFDIDNPDYERIMYRE